MRAVAAGVVDSGGRTPRGSAVLDDAAPTWIATAADVGATADGRVDLGALVKQLYAAVSVPRYWRADRRWPGRSYRPASSMRWSPTSHRSCWVTVATRSAGPELPASIKH